MRGIDWDDLRVFSAIARGGSVRAAAKALGIHHSTVARRLDQLEGRLGVHLFTRTPLGLRLTAEGRAVLDRAERVETEIDALERRLQGQDQRLEGPIRLTLPDAVAAGFLMEDLARFTLRYPEINLEFIPTYEALDLGRRQADVAIRVTHSPPEFLVGRNLGPFAIAVYGSRSYLAEHDPFTRPEACNWVSWGTGDRLDEWRRDVFPAIPSRTRCGTVLLQLAAVRAGVGIAPLPCALADPDPLIERVSGIDPVLGPPIWLLTHPDLRAAARVRALMAFVVECFEARRDLLLGDSSRDGDAHAPERRTVKSLEA